LVVIESSTLAVTVLPEVGGKVGQILHKTLGCNLLIAPRKPYRTIPLHGDWLQYDTSGMDDCFPNIARGSYIQGVPAPVKLPDIGEWSHGKWEILSAARDHVMMQRPGVLLPYFAQKRVSLVNESTLEFAYSVENRGTSPLRYMWSAHPLIDVQNEYELVLPSGDLDFRVFPSDGEMHRWPDWNGLDLSQTWISKGMDLKIFVVGLTEGWCELRCQSYTLRFTFDLSTTPVLGIWFNNFGFPAEGGAPFRCVAVEPCTSPSDLLDELDSTAYPVIPPGATAAWSLRLEVVPATTGPADMLRPDMDRS